MTRRDLVRLAGGALVAAALAGCGDDDGAVPNDRPTSPTPSLPPAGASSVRPAPTLSPGAPERFTYGDDESQWAELHRATGERRPGTVIVLHGGFWRAQYGADLGTPLAADLAARGWTAWNVEYRRVGNGGGWPTTMADVAAAIDRLADVGAIVGPDVVDLDRVVTLGHSAGGHLAVWAAARHLLSAGEVGAAPAVTVTGAVSQAGVLDLAGGVDLGSGAVVDLLGGTPADVPERYAAADPMAHLPLGVPVRCVHGRDDAIVPMVQSERYVDAAVAAGDDAALVAVDGDHFAVIDVTTPAWEAIIAAVDELTAR